MIFLKQYGLKVKEVTGDGNCLYRAIADFLEGNENLWPKYKQATINKIIEKKAHYSPFIEDDKDFDQYLIELQEDGAWGGNLEIQALGEALRFNCTVHKDDGLRIPWFNFEAGTVPTVHISFHNGDHYNSIRRLDDAGTGPAKPIGHDLKIKELPS